MDIDDNDFGFTMVEKITANKITVDPRMEAIKKLVFPFLDNLMKSPEKDIHWPNRDVTIAAFKAKLIKVMDDN